MSRRVDFTLIAQYNDLVTDDMVRDKALVGSADDIVRQIVEIAGTGINEITIYPLTMPGQDIETVLDSFSRDIKPRVDKELA